MKTLDLYITKICNLDCEYCYVDVVKSEQNAFPATEFLERIDLLQYDNIKFFGGEPLVRFQMIQQIVDAVHAKKKSMNFTIVTNGILLSSDKVEYILKRPINVVVSIHEGSYPSLKKKIDILGQLNDKVGFYIIFDPANFQITLRNFLFFTKHGFRNYCFAPEIYGDWSDTNLSALERLLEKLTPYILKFQMSISWIPHNMLKLINRGCEKTVYDETGKFRPCNRFRSLDKKEKFNYKEIYDRFDSVIDFENDPMKWFYICPVGWYLDNESNNIDLSIEQFKKLNHVFIRFYKNIHKHHLTFFSDDIEEIRFNLTEQCNLRCEYCYVDFKNKVLDIAVAKNIVDFFLMQDWGEKNFAFFGGEPLLEYKRLVEIVEYISKQSKEKWKKVQYSIATNFTIVNNEIADFLKEHDFNIHISFNGAKKTNDTLRDMSSDLVLKNIEKYFTLSEKAKICILFAFGPQEVSDIYTNLKYLIWNGFREFNLELIFWKKYNWQPNHVEQAMAHVTNIYQEFPEITLHNLEEKNKFLDINTDGKSSENSLEFFSQSIDMRAKNYFDELLKKIKL